jgi:hypothetical protein
MPRLLERVNFPKLVTVLAAIFGIALGACGLTALVGARFNGASVLPLGIVELVVMVLSAVGLLISLTVWGVASALGKTAAGGPDTIRLFDDSDKTKS